MIAPCQQTGNDACQHVAAARGGHAGIAGTVEGDVAVGTAEGRVVTLEDDVALQAFCQFAGLGQSLVAVSGVPLQSVEFFGVGGKDEPLGKLHEPCTMVGQHVEGVRIYHDGALCAPKLGYKGDGGGLTLSESWPYAQCLVVIGVDSL